MPSPICRVRSCRVRSCRPEPFLLERAGAGCAEASHRRLGPPHADLGLYGSRSGVLDVMAGLERRPVAAPPTSRLGCCGSAPGRWSGSTTRRPARHRRSCSRSSTSSSPCPGRCRAVSAAGRGIRPRHLGVRRRHLVRSLPVDPRGRPPTSARRTPRVPRQLHPPHALCSRRGRRARLDEAVRPQRGMHRFDGPTTLASSSTSPTAT